MKTIIYRLNLWKNVIKIPWKKDIFWTHTERDEDWNEKERRKKNNKEVIHYFKKEKKLSETPVNHN